MRIVKFRGKYYAAWQEAGHIKRISLRTDSLDLAKQRLEDAKRQKAAKDETIGAIMDAYLTERGGDGQKFAWKAAKAHFAHLRPDQITRPLCMEYTEQRRRDRRSNGTILKELSTIRSALNWAGMKGFQFEMPSAPPPRERWLTKHEFRRLLDSAAAPHVALFIHLALATGARAGAILSLTWMRVDLHRKLIRLAGLETQTNKRRPTVPITDSLLVALTEAREAALSDWVIEHRGAQVKSIKTGFSNAAARAGLHGVTPHVLRHTAAVWMAEARVPMEEIAAYLGHTDPKITFRHYAKYSPDFLREAASALEF